MKGQCLARVLKKKGKSSIDHIDTQLHTQGEEQGRQSSMLEALCHKHSITVPVGDTAQQPEQQAAQRQPKRQKQDHEQQAAAAAGASSPTASSPGATAAAAAAPPKQQTAAEAEEPQPQQVAPAADADWSDYWKECYDDVVRERDRLQDEIGLWAQQAEKRQAKIVELRDELSRLKHGGPIK